MQDTRENLLSLSQVLTSLPVLGDDLYLRMQAMNLEMVDYYIRSLEQNLRQKLFDQEETPIPDTLFVSALSQLWVFGLYELLRTWRQRIQDILKFAGALKAMPRSDWSKALEEQTFRFPSGHPDGSKDRRWQLAREIAEDETLAKQFQTSIDCSERVFRRIEALRIHLAKHELPKSRGSVAVGPGYGRISGETGSIYWQVILDPAENEVDVVSRQNIADDILRFGEDSSSRILTTEVQERVKELPKFSYGMKRISVTLSDGRRFPGVFVAWNKEIIAIEGYDSIPFDPSEIVGVASDI